MNIAPITSAARLIVGAAALLALLLAGRGIDQRAYQRGHLAAQNQQLHAAVQNSQKLAADLDQLISQYEKEKANAKSDIERLGADLRSGAIRLHIRTAPTPAASPGATGPAAPGPEPAHAELDRATAAALVGITAAGDDAIRALNTCIDRYNSAAAVQLQTSPSPAP